MPPVPVAGQPSWHVTDQEEHPTFDTNGQPTTLHHVHFKTQHGVESHVTLPDSHYSAANVAAQIHHKAREIDTVHTMTSVSHPAQAPE